MRYVSTRNTTKTYDFKDVFIKGLADDGGLFIPSSLPKYSEKEIQELKSLNYSDLAKKIIFPFIGNFMDKNELSKIIDKSYSVFRRENVIDFIKIGDRSVLELFHGPTLAFKDVAMQLLGNFYEFYLSKQNEKINIVVATSGDTGAAAIDAIKGKENLNIFVLHPDNRVSSVQRKIMTTGKHENVFNIAIKGNFDDCQNLVKSMFSDKKFSQDINMSGVNSINWARIIAQCVYYFYSYYLIEDHTKPTNFSVPTGNFGDVYAGYLAKKMGLPINKLLIATNKNDILKRVVKTGIYKPLQVRYTISPSMDIQVASNFERLIFDLCSCSSRKTSKYMSNLQTKGKFKIKKNELAIIRKNFLSESLTEKETRKVIHKVYKNYKILIDPHTAVAVGVMDKLFIKEKTLILSTAHPAKFSDTVMRETRIKPQLPKNLNNILLKKEKFKKLPKNIKNIKEYILKNIV